MKPISVQLKRIILQGPMSRYQIAKESGVDASTLHRFVNSKGQLTTKSLDKIGKVLNLKITIEE